MVARAITLPQHMWHGKGPEWVQFAAGCKQELRMRAQKTIQTQGAATTS